MKWVGKRILVVDDSPLVRATLVKMLRGQGYSSVHEAPDGQTACSMILSSPYDMILSDYDMPGMNGEELLGHIKKRYPGIIMIILSGQADKNVVVNLMRHADDYIIKNEIQYIQDEIIFSIENAFQKNELEKENRRLFRQLQERNNRLKQELVTARSLLEDVLPRRIPKSDVFEIQILNRPSNIIGGDYFQFTRMGDDIYGLVADIAGHGIPAALLLLTMKNTVDEVLYPGIKTDSVLEQLNSKLMNAFPESSYATISGLRLNETDGSISYTNEFQNPILHVKKDGSVEEIDNGHIKFIGMKIYGINDENRLPMASDVLHLQPGERILIYTDGIVELMNDNEFFGHDRIKANLGKNAQQSLRETICDLYADAKQFSCGIIEDDITIIGIGMKN